MIEKYHHDAAILEIRLSRPPVNALNPALIISLRETVQKGIAEGARAIVLSGNSGLFSAGLDVPALLALDTTGMLEFWRNFNALLATLGRSPVPIVAAITGHCPAGGAVLSLFCDYRIMAEGDYKIGLNEVQVGLVVPDVIQFAMRRILGSGHRAERLLVAGTLLSSEAAYQQGLVDELAAPQETIDCAIAWCARHLALPHLAFSETRRIARADLHQALDDAEHSIENNNFVDRWFMEETQTSLHALMARLKK